MALTHPKSILDKYVFWRFLKKIYLFYYKGVVCMCIEDAKYLCCWANLAIEFVDVIQFWSL